MKTNRKRHLLVSLTLCLYLLIGLQQANAQEQQQVVQLSGLITSEDSLRDMSGVTVYVPNTAREVFTVQNGFFSLPVLRGDSVVISMLGYQKQYLLIPKGYKSNSYTAHILLQEGLTELPTVDVMPWATEREFKSSYRQGQAAGGAQTTDRFGLSII